VTAEEFDQIFQQRIDKSYNKYKSPSQRQSLYKQALYYALESIYKSGVDQEWTDEIRSMLKINTVFTLPMSGVLGIPTDIPDYNHYLFARAEYLVNSYAFIAFTFSGSGTILAHSNVPLPFRDYTKVRIEDCPDMSEVNGDFYLKQIGRLSWALYQDILLTIPVTTTIPAGLGAKATEIQINDCVVQFSDQKIQKLDIPSKRYPKVQVGQDSLYVLPAGGIRLYMDYVTNPPVFITETNGVFNNTFDLETVYPAKFLYQIIGKAVDIFNVERKDEDSFRENVQLDKMNP
jgi:hypothetical protein